MPRMSFSHLSASLSIPLPYPSLLCLSAVTFPSTHPTPTPSSGRLCVRTRETDGIEPRGGRTIRIRWG